MRVAGQPEVRGRGSQIYWFIFAAVAATLLVIPAAAQQRGAMPPPLASSIGGHTVPFPPPSITSIKPFGFGGNYHSRFGNHCRYGCGYGNGYGAWAFPYYIPLDSYGYGYDYMGGPDAYAPPMAAPVPPVGPVDPGLHIVAEQPTADAYHRPDDMPDSASPPRIAAEEPPAPPARELKPAEPTVLIFRDGHQQEVTNYAIMGDTVYVFDDGRKKIALADLDVPATMKANDDRGLEFTVPPPRKRAKGAPAPAAPTQTTPDAGATTPNNLTSALR